MSSFLFSPLCLDPLQGVLDFTADVKPFRTKVVQAGISILFSDTIRLSVKEELFFDLEQLFHTHRGNCVTAPIPCVEDGFESEVFDDELGFEPTIRYTTAEYPIGTPTVGMLNFIGFSAAGNPVFVVAEECVIPDPPCPEGFEMYPYDQAYFDFTDPDCIDTCNHVYVGPCSENNAICADNSPTTIATTFAEYLTIEDDDGIILNITGSEIFEPIYATDRISNTIQIVTTGANQAVYHG